MAERSRSEKLARLVKVQRHLEKMAESELAQTTRAREEVQETMAAAVDAIGNLDSVHQLFATQYSAQISRLTAKDQHLETVQQIHEQRIMREKAKGDRLAENMKDARDAEDRLADDESVYDVIDQAIALSGRQDPV